MTTTDFYEFNSLSLAIVCLLFSFLSIFLAIATINWGIVFNDEGFEYRTLLGRTYLFRYGDIIEINVGNSLGVMKTLNNKKLFFDPNVLNVKEFLGILESKKNKNTNGKEIVIKLPKGYFWIGVCCFSFFLYISIMLVIPNDSFERVTSLWGYMVLFGVNYALFIVTFGSLKWRIFMNNSTFIYITYFGNKYDFEYTDVKKIKVISNLVVLKVKNRIFFVDTNAYGIETFLKKIR